LHAKIYLAACREDFNFNKWVKQMKTMSCKQLGGACDQHFQANTFEEIGDMSKQHAMKMLQQNDEAHVHAMNKMKELMQKPEAMKDWFANKKKEFDGLPDD
jgi:predicted small metal-binding protein